MNNNNQNIFEMKWGTQAPLSYIDKVYGRLTFNVYGLCKYTTNEGNREAIEDQIRNNIIQTAQIFLSKIKLESINDLQTNYTSGLRNTIMAQKSNYYTIQSVEIHGVRLTDESQKIIDDFQTRNKTVVVKTDEGAKDGQTKCPKCGSTEISTNVNNGLLRCEFCRHEFEAEKITGMVSDLSKLEGQVIGSGASNIAADTNDVLTFKCTSCGAEVVIDTSSATNARCHWCRNTLSVNQQIPNGAIPDVVLPFNVTKDVARQEIEKFVGKRKFFANPKFRSEFTTNNIMGVYFPYMIVDVNAHVNFIGEGEHQTRCYTRGSGNNQTTYYDADLYHVEREFDLVVDGLSVESSSDRLNSSSKEKTNNIINAIMPFDVENCVKYNANYLKGYTSEKRDTNIEQLKNLVDTQAKDIARFAANESLKNYDRGVAWSTEQMNIKGEQWKAAYLPVWLYSYQEVKGQKKLLHYVAVNARTKETMGSVPIHIPKLVIVSILVEILGFFAMMFADFDYNWLFLSSGFIFFIVMYLRYRNSNARHTYETETKKQIGNLRKVDNFIQSRRGLTNSMMNGANNKRVNGRTSGNKITDSLTKENVGNTIVNSVVNSNSLAGFIKNNIDKK